MHIQWHTADCPERMEGNISDWEGGVHGLSVRITAAPRLHAPVTDDSFDSSLSVITGRTKQRRYTLCSVVFFLTNSSYCTTGSKTRGDWNYDVHVTPPSRHTHTHTHTYAHTHTHTHALYFRCLFFAQ